MAPPLKSVSPGTLRQGFSLDAAHPSYAKCSKTVRATAPPAGAAAGGGRSLLQPVTYSEQPGEIRLGAPSSQRPEGPSTGGRPAALARAKRAPRSWPEHTVCPQQENRRLRARHARVSTAKASGCHPGWSWSPAVSSLAAWPPAVLSLSVWVSDMGMTTLPHRFAWSLTQARPTVGTQPSATGFLWHIRDGPNQEKS